MRHCTCKLEGLPKSQALIPTDNQRKLARLRGKIDLAKHTRKPGIGPKRVEKGIDFEHDHIRIPFVEGLP